MKTNGLGLVRKEILNFNCVFVRALLWRVSCQFVRDLEILETNSERISSVKHVFGLCVVLFRISDLNCAHI